MSNDSLFFSVQVIVWTCVALFIATVLTTMLALVGKVRLGGGDGSRHDYYLRRLFLAVVVEVVGISLSAYAAYVSIPKGAVSKIDDAPPTVSPSKSVTPTPGVELVRETISAKAYASSDGSQSEQRTIEIPIGSKYVTHTVNVWTKNGRSTYTARPVVDPATGRVTAVSLSASVGKRDLFGPRNWIGVELVVTVEKRSS